MKQRLLSLLLFVLFLGVSNYAVAQNESSNNKIKLDFGADLYSRYVWRGSQFGGSSPSLQPGISATYKNLELGAWGAYSLGGNNPSQELDLYVNYTFLKGLFSVIITDYYFPTEFGNYNYFSYKTDETGHVFEAGLSFNGTKKLPMTFSAYVNFYGADAAKLNSNPLSTGFNKKTGIQYSNYFELAYSASAYKVDFNVFVGATLNNPAKADDTTGFLGETGFYGNGPGIVNLGVNVSKAVKITKNYSIPLSASLIMNPQAKHVFLVFGLSI